tara:strand:+ start:6365 stop:6775 length:411 start_codon:yes stop_codon:yes gene_type:complete
MHHSDDDNPETNTQGMPAHMLESPPLTTYSEATANTVTANFQNHLGIKYDIRISSSIELSFESVETDTDKAILLNIFNENTGEVVEEWFPKKLCSNLDEHACTIRVWDVFAKDKKGHLFPTAPVFSETEAEAKPNG